MFLLAGCTTTPGSGEAPPDWSTNGVVPAPALAPNVVPLVVLPPLKTNLPPVIRTNLPPVVVLTNPPPPVIKPAPILIWTSLDRWLAENRIGSLRRLTGGPTTRFYTDTKNGLLVLEIGSREAIWRGMELHLGFPPEIIDGQVFVHGLDLRKNLMPLIVGAPLCFSTNLVLVLDPGHGGVAGGTISVLDKRPEKEFTLDLARRIKPLLEQKGWQVFLARTNDADVALSNRVNFAEAHHADFFVSLHFNSAAPDKRQSGLETYCLTPVGMPSTLTRGNPDVWSQGFPNNSYDTANLQLAVRLHAALLHATGAEDRGVRRARFMGVLHGPHCPAVLIEGGYLSNPREAEHIESAAYRQKMAEAIAGALK